MGISNPFPSNRFGQDVTPVRVPCPDLVETRSRPSCWPARATPTRSSPLAALPNEV